ncbi:hypothetical protein MRX96_044845 [Rhipicephalus microplus]
MLAVFADYLEWWPKCPRTSSNGFITDAWNLAIKSAKSISLDLIAGSIVSQYIVRITCAACEDASLT